MKIGIIGAGRMGGALAKRWARAGHQVYIGSRTPDKAQQIAAQIGGGAQSGTYHEAAAFADVILFSVPFRVAQETLADLGDLHGKVLIECTNDMSSTDAPEDSSAEKIAAWATGARVVKAFNTVFSDILASDQPGDLGSVFVVGDDDAAKASVMTLVKDAGFAPVDTGTLADAHYLDTLVRLIIHLGIRKGMGRTLGYRVEDVVQG